MFSGGDLKHEHFMSQVQILNRQLSTEETNRYYHLKAKCKSAWIDLAVSLLEIHNRKLYLAEYDTFEDFCKSELQIARSRAYQFIDAARTIENVHNCGHNILPITESQARPLTKLEPEIQREAWAEVVERHGEDVTAAKVEEVADRWTDTNNRLRELKAENEPNVFNPEPRPADELVQQAKTEVAPKMRVHYTSDSEEWYTPREVVAAVERFFKVIDLDPCSNSHEAPNIPASNHFTQQDNGLLQDWMGRVYVNPPYGRVISEWTEKAKEEYESGSADEIILLVPARTDTAWFNAFSRYPRCFIKGRLKFSDSADSAPFPSCLIYLGDRDKEFAAAFKAFGDTYKAI